MGGGLRFLDIIIAIAVLVFALPLMLFIAAAIRLQDGGPALFSQTRLGQGGRDFRCFKFRTMVMDAEGRLAALFEKDPAARLEWEAHQKLRGDPRVTPLGLFLRRSSLDELPQLFNVLRGDMSIVGPRPIVQAEIARYGRSYPHYCRVRPGLTGLWQVSGRNTLSYRRRVALDRLYATAKSPGLDIAIILKTFAVVLLGSGY